MTRLEQLEFKIAGPIVADKKHIYEEIIKQAHDLNLVGWISQDKDGQVKCKAQGVESSMNHMKEWLTKTIEINTSDKEMGQLSQVESSDINQLEYENFKVLE
jgi:acylphosphatase